MAGAGPRQGDGRSRHPRCFAWPRGGPHPRARAAQGGPQAGSGPQSRPRAQGRGSHARTWTQPGASVREGRQSRRTCRRRLLLLQVIHQRVNLVSASDVHCKRRKRHRHAAPPSCPLTAPAPITALRTEGHLSAGGAGRPSPLRLLRAGRPGASPFSYVGRGRTGTAELRYVDSLGGGTAGLLQAQKHMLSIRDSIQMPRMSPSGSRVRH